QVLLVRCDCKSDDSVPTRESFGGVQPEESSDRGGELNLLRDGDRGGMGEDGSELISADELATPDFQGCQAPFCHGRGNLDGGEDLVAHSQLLGDDPFWLTSTDFMPRGAPTVVPVAVLRVSLESVAGGHANRNHSIRLSRH